VFTLRYKLILFLLTAALLPGIHADAEDSSSYNQKGMNELYGNHPGKAAEFFMQAISIDPAQKIYYNNLAAAYMRLEEYSKAEEQLKISLKFDCNYARALSNMSVTLFHLGRYKESYNFYRLSKKADSEYTRKRFDKNRVSSIIKKTSDAKPDDEELKSIRLYMKLE